MFCRVPDIFNYATDFMQKCGSLTLSPTPRSPHINLKLFVKIAFCHIYQINLGSSVYRRVPSIFPPKNYFFNRKVARRPPSLAGLKLNFCQQIANLHIYQKKSVSSGLLRAPSGSGYVLAEKLILVDLAFTLVMLRNSRNLER